MKRRRLKKLARKVDIITGLTGTGRTLLDLPVPKLGPRERKWIRTHQMEVKELIAIKQDAFRQACIDVLGEDPNDWEEEDLP